jgi:hypothetical protein
MATRKAATTKKTTASKASAAKTTAKRGSSKKLPLPLLRDEQRPTGKFAYLYVVFACTTLIFAATTVWLFYFSANILNKYDEIEACARTTGASCEVHINGDESAEEPSTEAVESDDKE